VQACKVVQANNNNINNQWAISQKGLVNFRTTAMILKRVTANFFIAIPKIPSNLIDLMYHKLKVVERDPKLK
jgi:hypothetical protein